MLGRDSLVLRHALRVAIVTAGAVWLAGALHLSRGYWVTITAVIILQPYTGVDDVKAVQRVLGTIVGGILTAALGALFHDVRAILVLSFIFAAVSVAVLPDQLHGVLGVPHADVRAAGGGERGRLASRGRSRDQHAAWRCARVVRRAATVARAGMGAASTYMAAALRANRDYLRTVVSIFADRSDAAGHLMRERRRDAALAAINAEESFQRLLGEHGGSVGALAPVMTFLTYVRRFTVSIAALAVSRHAVDPSTAHVLERFSERTTTRLDEAAARLAAVAGGADVVRGVDGDRS